MACSVRTRQSSGCSFYGGRAEVLSCHGRIEREPGRGGDLQQYSYTVCLISHSAGVTYSVALGVVVWKHITTHCTSLILHDTQCVRKGVGVLHHKSVYS